MRRKIARFDNEPLERQARAFRKKRALQKIAELGTSGKISRETIKSMNISKESRDRIEEARLAKNQIGVGAPTMRESAKIAGLYREPKKKERKGGGAGKKMRAQVY